MSSNRVLYYNEHIGAGQYRLRIRKPKGDSREWFVYHQKTQSIRLASRKSWAISNQLNYGVSRGKALVLRNYKNSAQTIYYEPRTQRLHNGRDTRFCVDVWGGRNRDGTQTTFWSCHNGANQRWFFKYYPGVPRNTGFRHGQRFKI